MPQDSMRPEAGAPKALPAFLQASAPDVPPPSRTGSEPLRGFAIDLLIAGSLAVAAFLAYLPALSNSFVEFDDPQYVTANPVVKQGMTLHGIHWAFTTGTTGNWFPMVWLSHLATVSLFGLNPAWHHAVNTVLHACNAALVFLVLRSMTGRQWCAAAAAALWAFHPLRVESVAWVTERKDVLSGLFFLLTLLAYSHYVHRPSVLRYGLVLLLFAVALMSKSVVVTAPFLLLLLDVWPLQRGRWTVRILAEKIPLLLLSAIASTWTIVLQRNGHEMKGIWSLGQCIANADVSVSRYLLKTFWPTGLSPFYPYPDSWPAGAVIASSVLIAGVTLAAWLLRKRMPYVLIGWLWFLGMLVPNSGLVQVGFQSMADRYTYLPSIGLSIAIVWAGAGLVGGRSATVGLPGMPPEDRRRGKMPGPSETGPVADKYLEFAKVAAVPFLAVVVLAVVTWRREGIWDNTLDLFADALAVDDENWRAHDLVGAELVKKGDDADAMIHFRRSAQLNPRSPFSFVEMGTVLRRRPGQTAEAVALFRTAVDLAPEMAVCHQWLGIGLAMQQDHAGADREFAAAARLDPADPTILSSWAIAMAARGQFDRARELARSALDLDPTDPHAIDALQKIDRLEIQRSSHAPKPAGSRPSS